MDRPSIFSVSVMERRRKFSSSSTSSDLRIKTLKTSPVDIQFSSIREEEDISFENLTF